MSKADIFQVVMLGRLVLPSIASLLLYWLLTRPTNKWTRAVIAIISGWVLFFVYTVHAYNPAGIAAGLEQGMASPETHFDNNTVAVALVAGWLYPAASVLISAIIHKVWLLISRGAPGRR